MIWLSFDEKMNKTMIPTVWTRDVVGQEMVALISEHLDCDRK